MPEDVAVPLVAGGSPQTTPMTTGQKIARLLQIFGLSLLLGFFVGWAIKSNLATVLLLIIIVIVIIQVAACYGLMTIHWREIKNATKRCLDQDGDGKVDCKDCKLIFQNSFTYAIAIALGIIIGFVGAFLLETELGGCKH